MEKEGGFSVCERGMVVGVRRADLSVSETADFLGFSFGKHLKDFTENGPKKR